jgi:hypothetical protein
MKTKLKPPGTKRLKLRCDILLSNSAFEFKLRRYNLDGVDAAAGAEFARVRWQHAAAAGAYPRSHLSSTWAVFVTATV